MGQIDPLGPSFNLTGCFCLKWVPISNSRAITLAKVIFVQVFALQVDLTHHFRFFFLTKPWVCHPKCVIFLDFISIFSCDNVDSDQELQFQAKTPSQIERRSKRVNLTHHSTFLLLSKTRFVDWSWVFDKKYSSLGLFYIVFDVIEWILTQNCHFGSTVPGRFGLFHM